MSAKTIFGREPAAILAAVQAVLYVALGFGAPFLDETLITLVIAALGAGLNLVLAVQTRPVAPAAFTALVTAVAPLVGHFGFDVTAEHVGYINAAIVSVMALLVRGQVAPAKASLRA